MLELGKYLFLLLFLSSCTAISGNVQTGEFSYISTKNIGMLTIEREKDKLKISASNVESTELVKAIAKGLNPL